MTLDLPAWQRVLDRHQDLFTELIEGASVGLIAKDALAAEHEPLPMLAWERGEERMRAAEREFRGFSDAKADMLFVAQDGALDAVLARADENPLGELKLQIRRGRIQVFVMCGRRELAGAGYEDFVEFLGLPFLGPCR